MKPALTEPATYRICVVSRSSRAKSWYAGAPDVGPCATTTVAVRTTPPATVVTASSRVSAATSTGFTRSKRMLALCDTPDRIAAVTVAPAVAGSLVISITQSTVNVTSNEAVAVPVLTTSPRLTTDENTSALDIGSGDRDGINVAVVVPVTVTELIRSPVSEATVNWTLGDSPGGKKIVAVSGIVSKAMRSTLAGRPAALVVSGLLEAPATSATAGAVVSSVTRSQNAPTKLADGHLQAPVISLHTTPLSRLWQPHVLHAAPPHMPEQLPQV